MKYCNKCKRTVTTIIKFNKFNMAYLYCEDCDSYISQGEYEDEQEDCLEGGFMNDFGDSN